MTIIASSPLVALLSSHRLDSQLPDARTGLPSASVFRVVLAVSLDRQRTFFARMVRHRWDDNKPPIRTVWELRLLVDLLLADPELLFPKNREEMELDRRLPWDVFHDMMTAEYPKDVAFPVRLCRLITGIAGRREMSSRLGDAAHELLRSVGFHVHVAEVRSEPSGQPGVYRCIVREAIRFDEWGCPVRLVFVNRRSNETPLADGVLVAYDPRSSDPVRGDSVLETERSVDLHIAEPYISAEFAALEARGGRLL